VSDLDSREISFQTDNVITLVTKRHKEYITPLNCKVTSSKTKSVGVGVVIETITLECGGSDTTVD